MNACKKWKQLEISESIHTPISKRSIYTAADSDMHSEKGSYCNLAIRVYFLIRHSKTVTEPVKKAKFTYKRL